MQQTVLILGGSGKIGAHAADAFWNAGWHVRHFDRKTDDMTAAAMGADVIVNGLNPPAYHDWKNQIPAITQAVIAAAKASGATVIIPANIYNFGNHPGTYDESTPHRPNTRKGQIRVEMEQAYAESGVKTILLRAGNFIDPAGNSDIMEMLLMRAIAKGKLTSAGDPNALQTYCYVPDWARAAVMLAEERQDLSQFEDVPFPGHAFTISTLLTRIKAVTDRPLRLVRFPWWLMTLLSPFWELAREMREMRYLYSMPHAISETKFARLLPDFRPTHVDEVMFCGLPTDIHPNKVMRSRQHAVVTQ